MSWEWDDRQCIGYRCEHIDEHGRKCGTYTWSTDTGAFARCWLHSPMVVSRREPVVAEQVHQHSITTDHVS